MNELSGFPLLDFDPTPEAILEPGKIHPCIDAPTHFVLCFFNEVIERVVASKGAREIYRLRSEVRDFPIYEIEYRGRRLAFFQPGVGAPLAAGLLEEAIALGGKHFIACGGCGVLDERVACGHLLIPTAAIRGEGTSYYYLPASAEIQVSEKVQAVLEHTLRRRELPYLLTKSWTTDALYRETPAKAARFKANGCLAVEMELAAFLAVSQFRGVDFGQILYGGDAVIEEGWNQREWHTQADVRENLFWLAAEACLNL